MRKAGFAALAAATMAMMPAGVAAQHGHTHAELTAQGVITGSPGSQNDERVLYEAGSIGKFACTLAALQLADSGVFSIDDMIGDLLPVTANTPIAAVTLRQVLASRSGISDGLLPAFGQNPQSVMATPDALAATSRFATGELSAHPGSIWSYDLINWVVVQAVLEARTGQPISELLDQLVLRPAGMGQSRIFTGMIGENAAPPAHGSPPLPGFLTCAGGLATTPTDLIALVRFPHHGGLSSASLRDLMTVLTDDEDYALGGRFITGLNGLVLSWQSGSNGAYKSLVTYDPVSDIGFAAMTASGSKEEIEAARTQWMKAQAP